MKLKVIGLAISLLLLSQTAVAQAPQDVVAKVDALFRSWSASTPGCAVGIARNGDTLLTRAYGSADLEHDVPNTPDTIFETGSVAKQFTATAVLLLEKDGKLELSDDIRKYLPEMPDYGTSITIDMLLNHTNGLRDWFSMARAEGLPAYRRSVSNADVLDMAARHKTLNFRPGAEFLYTNTGYTLAAILVERVSGKSFQDFTKERIFAPLGMTHSSWRDDFNRIVKNRAVAYVSAPVGGYRQAMPFMNAVGSGGVLTTIGDLLIWNESLTQDKLGVTKALETRGKLTSGKEIDYARGLMIGTYKGTREVSHDGSTGGYTTSLARYPQQGVSIALLCNTPHGLSSRQIADIFLSAPAAANSAPTVAASGMPDPTPYAGLFINITTGMPMTISVSDGELKASGAAPLTRVSNERWETATGESITFDGANEFVARPVNGEPLVYKRVQRAQLTAAQLGEFTGAFASAETGATYRTVVENGVLTLKIDRTPEATLRLVPSYKDAFTAFTGGAMLIRFHRDKAGKITEMSLADGRMRDLRAAAVK